MISGASKTGGFAGIVLAAVNASSTSATAEITAPLVSQAVSEGSTGVAKKSLSFAKAVTASNEGGKGAAAHAATNSTSSSIIIEEEEGDEDQEDGGASPGKKSESGASPSPSSSSSSSAYPGSLLAWEGDAQVRQCFPLSVHGALMRLLFSYEQWKPFIFLLHLLEARLDVRA